MSRFFHRHLLHHDVTQINPVAEGSAGISNPLQDVACANGPERKCQVFLPLRKCKASKDLKTKLKKKTKIPRNPGDV